MVSVCAAIVGNAGLLVRSVGRFRSTQVLGGELGEYGCGVCAALLGLWGAFRRLSVRFRSTRVSGVWWALAVWVGNTTGGGDVDSTRSKSRTRGEIGG